MTDTPTIISIHKKDWVSRINVIDMRIRDCANELVELSKEYNALIDACEKFGITEDDKLTLVRTAPDSARGHKDAANISAWIAGMSRATKRYVVVPKVR